MIDPQDLADEMYKLGTPYYDDIPEKTKHDIAYKNALAKAAEKEQQNQMNNLSDILKNTQPLPQQFAGMQNVERDPIKRQQILDTQEQAMIAKQNAGGTFTDADLEPYKRAGYQSQNTQSVSPMADQFVQAVGAGVDPNVAKTAIGMNQPEEIKTGLHEIPNKEGGKDKVLMDQQGNVIKNFGSYKDNTIDKEAIAQEKERVKEYRYNLHQYNSEITKLQSEYRREVNKMTDSDEIEATHQQYQIEVDNVADKYKDRLDMQPVKKGTSNMPAQSNEPIFRINPATGKKQRWVKG